MEIVITEGSQQAAEVAADAICRLMADRANPVLGLATGSSPLPTYRELIRRHRQGSVGFAHARGFLLDEYVGLEPGHPEAYRTFIEREFVGQIDLPLEALSGPDGSGADLAGAPGRYENLIIEA